MQDNNQYGKPPDTRPGIQLNSIVTIREFYGKGLDTLQLVQPEKAHMAPNYLAINDPLAQKILGKKEGDLFEFRVISGAVKTFLILEVK